jgi:hypothetical protein
MVPAASVIERPLNAELLLCGDDDALLAQRADSNVVNLSSLVPDGQTLNMELQASLLVPLPRDPLHHVLIAPD